MFDNSSILITGGTGSFGQKCAAQLLENYNVKRVIIYSRDELKQFEMSQQLTSSSLRFFLGDVRDLPRLTTAMREVDYVYPRSRAEADTRGRVQPDGMH
jgi:UDP-N-acetylglucosamine 4,6-dehydratase